MPPNKDALPDSEETERRRATVGLMLPHSPVGPGSLPSNNCRRTTDSDCGSSGISQASSHSLTIVAVNIAECETLLSAKLHDTAKEDALPLVLHARLYNIGKLREAVIALSEAMLRLSKRLNEMTQQGMKSEKVFTPVLVNTIAKETAKIEDISKQLPTNVEDSPKLEHDLHTICDSMVQCVAAFEPIRHAVFRPNRRGNQGSDRVGNQTREYLQKLDVDWRAISCAKDALPTISKPLHHVTAGDEVEKGTLCDEADYDIAAGGTIRYWPV